MSIAVPEFTRQTSAVNPPERSLTSVDAAPVVMKSRPQTLLAIPVGALIALTVHFFIPKREPVSPTNFYPILLTVMLGLGLIGAVVQRFSLRLRRWIRNMCPILGVATVAAALWELVTSCLGLLPLPYFPGPEGVIASL